MLPPPPTHPLRATAIAALFAALGMLPACSESAPPAANTKGPASDPTPAAPVPDAPVLPDELNDLEALGYAGWDEDADWDEDSEQQADGLLLHEPKLAYPGINLYTDDRDQVIALDMQGRRLRTWRIPGRDQVEFAIPLTGAPYLVPGLLALSVDQGLTRIDKDGRVLWKTDFHAHHDIAALPDGSFLVPEWEEQADFHGRRVRFDNLVRLSPVGERIATWSTYEQRAALGRLHPASLLDRAPAQLPTQPPPPEGTQATTYDYYHLNSVAVFPPSAAQFQDALLRPGNLLICMRNRHLILILDGNTFEILWHWGPGELDHPHMPSLTQQGRILIFDNGRRRDHSRVIEVDPRTDRILWTYRADPPSAFHSEIRGACQRLPSGTTLITESERGRAFEVTADGTRVWEFLNPEMRGNDRRRIYRLLRYSATRMAPLL